jgi:hypothetical protein
MFYRCVVMRPTDGRTRRVVRAAWLLAGLSGLEGPERPWESPGGRMQEHLAGPGALAGISVTNVLR